MDTYDVIKKWADKDKRLYSIIDFEIREMTNIRLMALIYKRYNLKISCEGELASDRILLVTKKCKIINMIDAMMKYYEADVKRFENNEYQIFPGESENMAVYAGKTADQKKLNEVGAKFIADIMKNSTELNSRILSPMGIEFDNLPSSMQTSMKQMISSLRKYLISDGIDNPFPENIENGFSEYKIGVGISKKDGFSVASIRVHGAKSDFTFSVNDFLAKKENFMFDKTASGNVISGIKDSIPKDQIIKKNELQRLISLEMKNIYLFDVAKELNRLFNVDILCDGSRFWTQRSSVSFKNIPLWQALDGMTKSFLLTEWEYCSGGFIVVRGPYNPKRVRQKNEAELKRQIPRPRAL